MSTTAPSVPDSRHITGGWAIPSLHYCDQVYVVITHDGAWLSVMTTGSGKEGELGQHLIAQRSTDQGRTWKQSVAVEPADGPESSYAVLLKVPSGRVYAFYNHNTDRVPEVKGEDGGVFTRVDSLGHYVFKYSDDHGVTWSEQRYDVPIRLFEVDRKNIYDGKLCLFWNVGRPFVGKNGKLFLPHIKVGAMGHNGFFMQSEGVIIASENILTEKDPAKIKFETLPDGEMGLRTPKGGGRVSEEQSLVELSDGTLYCVYRSIDGYPVSTYSGDGGKTWTAPQYKTYTPDGKRMKHPRAANFVWKCENGRYLYWFHNHGGGESARGAWNPYDDRNPVWITAGHEIDTPQGKRLSWSQPEVLLYDDEVMIRMSYPDLVEDGGNYYVTETQKCIARTHLIAPRLINAIFAQKDNAVVAKDDLVLEQKAPMPATIPMPELPLLLERDYSKDDQRSIDRRVGVSIECKFKLAKIEPGQVLLDARKKSGNGWCVRTAANGALKITLNDGHMENVWRSDSGSLKAAQEHHVSVILDGGPKTILFIIDGVLQDGGEERQFGWGLYNPSLRHIKGSPEVKIDPAVQLVRIYKRALLVSEAVGNFKSRPSPAT